MNKPSSLIIFLLSIVFFVGFLSCKHPESEGIEQGLTEDTIVINKALFINPDAVTNEKSDKSIMNEVINYLNLTPGGAKVYIGMYLFYYDPVVEAVIDAYRRGVETHVMIDHSKTKSIENNAETISAFQSLFKAPSEIVLIDNDISSKSIMHEKFVLFSKVKMPDGMASKVVFITSHNFKKAGMQKIQDALVMSNDKLYNYFLTNWNDIAGRADGGMNNLPYKEYTIGDSIGLCFFPRRTSGAWDGKDNIRDILSRLSDFSHDTIRIMMANWDRLSIVEDLISLQQKGVRVEVLARGEDDVSAEVISALNQLNEIGGYVQILTNDKTNLHAKCMLIKGELNGEKQTLILTGSHNYTDASLKDNNELIIQLKNSSHFDEYWNYFSTVKDKFAPY